MDTNLQLLKQFYCELGISPTVESIDQRLVLQKVALLGQEIGVPLDYTYNWYVKGPYSPSLTEDYFELQGYEAEDSTFNFNETFKDRLDTLKDMIYLHKIEGSESVLPKWVEALASIAFLVNKSFKTKEQALNILEEKKPHISKDMREEALGLLEQHNIIK